MKDLLDNLDNIQNIIEELEKNWFVLEYLEAVKTKENLVENLKLKIKEWEDVKESETLIFKKSERYGYNPEKLREKLWWQAEHFIIQKESVDSKSIAKAIKEEIITQNIDDCKELQSISITVKPKSKELTDIEI